MDVTGETQQKGIKHIGTLPERRKRLSMKNKYVNKLLSVTVITLLPLLGCASTKYLPSTSETYPPTSSAVVYYWDKPDRPYIEMGTINVKAHSETGMFEKFKHVHTTYS